MRNTNKIVVGKYRDIEKVQNEVVALSLSGLGQGAVTSSSEYCNELSGYTESGEFL
jgi:hypothetical protein